MSRHQPHEYIDILAWHKSTGSFPYYWTRLQEEAAAEGAPLDAIYRRTDGQWARLVDCPQDVQDRINTYIAAMELHKKV